MYKLLGISMDNEQTFDGNIAIVTKVILKGCSHIITLSFYYNSGYIISSPVQNIPNRKYKLVEGKPYLEQVFKSEMIDWYYNYLFVDFGNNSDKFYNIYTDSCTISIVNYTYHLEVIHYDTN